MVHSVRRDELAAMQGMNALSIFYDRLKDIRELHRRTGAEESAVVAEGMDMDLMDEEGKNYSWVYYLMNASSCSVLWT